MQAEVDALKRPQIETTVELDASTVPSETPSTHQTRSGGNVVGTDCIQAKINASN
jgi:hypothetical protein